MLAKAKVDKPFSFLARSQGYKCHEYNGVFRPSKIYGYKSLLRNTKWLLMLPVSINSAYRVIKGTKCDIVHLNAFLNFIPLIASKLARKKVIFHLIGDHYPKWLVKRLHFILVLADKLQTYYLESAHSRNAVIYEPIRYNFIIENVANYTPAKDWLSFIEIAK